MKQEKCEGLHILKPMSKMRKQYFVRLGMRISVFHICGLFCIYTPDVYEILENGNFFKQFSVLHILWGIWMLDMICQIVPMKKIVPLGSQKLFFIRFRSVRETPHKDALRKYMRDAAKGAGKVLALWLVLLVVIGALWYADVLNAMGLFMISVFFYICDLICVLFWCPFRLIMKNRCCTTFSIFNWDHFMMFSPMIFITGVYSLSLVLMSLVVLGLWELFVILYPERFWERTNASLTCASCTDKLCTQFCPRYRANMNKKTIE